MNYMSLLWVVLSMFFASCQDEDMSELQSETAILYIMPEESEEHEGTWLQWPHHYQYGLAYRDALDPTWVAMTAALVGSENVHIIAYNQAEQDRITRLLQQANISLATVDFSLMETDDTWVRDNGPIYVRDLAGNLVVEDWGFNAWGNKLDDVTGMQIASAKCDNIPAAIADAQGLERVDLNEILINEGGSVEIDGNGALMACKSSILNDNRNPGVSQAEVEAIFKQYLGVTHFIWLEGQAGLEITDQHIDGFARFGNASTIVTMGQDDLLAFDVLQEDINRLYAAKNKEGTPYSFIQVPLTVDDVKTTAGVDLGYKGSYINYYIANTKVLVPNYNDPNDRVANAQIQALYPDREVVGIDVRNLYENGGMVHCVTQQQPKR